MSERQRILYVNHEVECGGAEHSLLELIQGLDRERFEPHLACSTEGPLTDRARALGVEIHLVPMLFRGKLRKLWGLLMASFRLRKLIRSVGIQMVHTNSLIAGYCGIFAAKLCRIPAIWHVRDISYPEPAKMLCSQAERIVANSRATANSLDIAPRFESKVSVVYNGVSPRFFEQGDSRDEVRQELRLGRRENLVGVFGRLDPWKGHRDFLRAAKLVLPRHPDTTFLVVGDTLFAGSRGRHGDYRAELERLARDLGIFGKVLFLGHRDDVPRLLGAVDLVVHPSAEPEPFGRTIAEAQAVGRPVIGSNLGGIPEVIDEPVTGLLFPAGDAARLADRIAMLLADPELAGQMGRAGRVKAEAQFTQAQYVAGIESIYRGLSRPS